MFAARSSLMAMAFIGALLAAGTPLLIAAESSATGTIAMAGKPLATGKITFHRDNGQFVGSKIKDGKYSIDSLPIGTMRVTIWRGGGDPPLQRFFASASDYRRATGTDRAEAGHAAAPEAGDHGGVQGNMIPQPRDRQAAVVQEQRCALHGRRAAALQRGASTGQNRGVSAGQNRGV